MTRRAKSFKVVIHGDSFADRQADIETALGDKFRIVAVGLGAAAEEKQAAFDDAVAAITVRYDAATPAPASLRLVQVPGIGWDDIDLAHIPPGANVCNVGGHETGVAEYAVAQMLEWCHRLRPAEESFRRGSWERSSRFGAAPHRELSGSTIGIVGFGAIGRVLARLLRGFGVRILVANRSPIPDGSGVDGRFALSDLPAMAAECDFLLVALALTQETRGLVDRAALDALGAKGVLVNVARGPVVDETALWQALSDRRLGGAVIDVWYRYPPAEDADQRPGHYPFETLPNLVMTPHLSGWTAGTVERRLAFMVENIRRAAEARPLLNVVSSPSTRAGRTPPAHIPDTGRGKQ
ncbi:2-hydroxyacid dehydrogenase [Nitratireductor sp. GCM10026969]|uniref:2-hydroxyacid dehydrogenase n=1 Tax=Nitratireductor sp. GCM10026969 TaxID=3252645 RepID=UPI00360CFE57